MCYWRHTWWVYVENEVSSGKMISKILIKTHLRDPGKHCTNQVCNYFSLCTNQLKFATVPLYIIEKYKFFRGFKKKKKTLDRMFSHVNLSHLLRFVTGCYKYTRTQNRQNPITNHSSLSQTQIQTHKLRYLRLSTSTERPRPLVGWHHDNKKYNLHVLMLSLCRCFISSEDQYLFRGSCLAAFNRAAVWNARSMRDIS